MLIRRRLSLWADKSINQSLFPAASQGYAAGLITISRKTEDKVKIMEPIETISTDNLLMSIERSVTIAFCFGFFGGLSLAFLSMAKGITENVKGIIVALDAIALLLFLFLADRYVRKVIIPEIRKRCRPN